MIYMIYEMTWKSTLMLWISDEYDYEMYSIIREKVLCDTNSSNNWLRWRDEAWHVGVNRSNKGTYLKDEIQEIRRLMNKVLVDDRN